MTHVFIFNNASRAANYGIGTYIRCLADGLAGCTDMRVSFMDMYAETKEYAVVDDEQGCRHYRIPAEHSQSESEQYCRNIFYFLARHIHAEAGERLVFQFNYFQHRPLAVLLKGQYPDSRIVLTVHYLGWCFELNGNKTRFRQLTAKAYRPQDDQERGILASVENERHFLHLADEVIVLSRDTQGILAEDYAVSPDKMHLVYNGLGDGLCLDKTEGDGNTRNILFVGRLDKIKGLDHLLKAFGQIATKHPDTRLLVAGDGDFQLYLSQCRGLQGRVSFLGRMTSGEVEELYRSAYIGVMPSFHEQCSYTAIEMMRHGIPLIGTDTTGLAEMFDATPQLCVHIDEEHPGDDDFVAQIASRLDLLLSDAAAYTHASAAVTGQYEVRYKAQSMIQGTLAAIRSSFARQDYIVSSDYLVHVDYRMADLIFQCPDIDMDFYGIGGIGVYLWRRVQELCGKEKDRNLLALIQEHLIYYMDWVRDMEASEALPPELWATIQDMVRNGFYKTCAEALLMHCPAAGVPLRMPSDKIIIQNALKICSCKI